MSVDSAGALTEPVAPDEIGDGESLATRIVLWPKVLDDLAPLHGAMRTNNSTRAMKCLMNWKVYLLAFAHLVLNCASAAEAAIQFQFTDLGTLGGNYSEGYAVNNLGSVVGASNLVTERFTSMRHALLNDGTVHNLATPGESYSVAYGINDSGFIVGQSDSAEGSRAFLYDGTMHDLGDVGFGTNAWATAINNAGEVIGIVRTSAGQHVFLYDGTMHNLEPADDYFLQAQAINNLGEVLINSSAGPYLYKPGIGSIYYENIIDPFGEWQGLNANGINDSGIIVGSGRHGGEFANAYLFDGTMHDLGRLDGSYTSMLLDVNSRGKAVGYAVTHGQGDFAPTFIFTPLFYSQETGLVDLNALVPGFGVLDAVAINDAGQITGTTYSEHAYLLTPLIPEPSGLVALASGLLAISVCRRNQSGRTNW